MDAVSLLPHQERLLRRIEALDTPLVQVWGWPGSGKSALLEAFCERLGSGARGLSLGELEAKERLREVVEESRAVRWLVALGGSCGSVAEAAR
jgi:Ni2+-binding GTPase involved in maturation of urease and hydrogenase